MDPNRELEWAVPVLAIVTAAALAITFGAELPDPVATRWSPDGTPDAARSRRMELVWGTLVIAVTGLVPVALADRAHGVGARRAMVVTGHVLVTFGLGHRIRTVAANHGATSWTEASSTLSVTSIVLAAALAGVFGWWVSGRRGGQRHQPPPAGAPGS